MLDALEMESRILWNFRFVVLNAVPVGILGSEKVAMQMMLGVYE